MKLYIIVHSNNKTTPGAWNASYTGKGIEIVQAFTSLEDVCKFLAFDDSDPRQASAMRKAWHAVEIDLEQCTPFEL